MRGHFRDIWLDPFIAAPCRPPRSDSGLRTQADLLPDPAGIEATAEQPIGAAANDASQRGMAPGGLLDLLQAMCFDQ